MWFFFITSIYPPQTGGGASRIYDFATNFAARGHSIFVFTYTPLREIRKARLFAQERGVWVLRTPSLLPRNPLDQIPLVFALVAIFAILFRPRATVLSVPAGEPCIGAYLAARICGVKAVFDVRDPWEDAIIGHRRRVKRVQYRLYKALFTRLYSKANTVLTVTPSLIRLLQARGSRPILLPNGADTDLFKPLDRTPGFLQRHSFIKKEDFAIIYAGRVGESYRLDIVIRAIEKLEQTRLERPLKLIIMGKGEKLAEYQNLTQALRLNEVVHFTGEVPRPEVAEVMNRCNLGVTPLDEDPLWLSAYGTKIFEHCASGLPTIVSILPGSDLEKLVNSRKIGYVVSPLNVEEFADRILQLHQDRELMRRMRANALRVAEEFSRKRLSERLLALIE